MEQDQLRTALLAAMFANTGNLQKQLSHAVFLMAKVRRRALDEPGLGIGRGNLLKQQY